jgi:hypothetical protein
MGMEWKAPTLNSRFCRSCTYPDSESARKIHEGYPSLHGRDEIIVIIMHRRPTGLTFKNFLVTELFN